jgi:hypothetical protein
MNVRLKSIAEKESDYRQIKKDQEMVKNRRMAIGFIVLGMIILFEFYYRKPLNDQSMTFIIPEL